MLEARMIAWGEEKGEVVLAQGLGCLVRRQINRNTKGLQDVRTARTRGNRPVPVLGHRHPGGRNDKSYCGRDVERVEAVSARPAYVYNAPEPGLVVNGRRDRQCA